MITWTQIIVILFGMLLCCATVAICDITIIKEIKKFTETLREIVILLKANNGKS